MWAFDNEKQKVRELIKAMRFLPRNALKNGVLEDTQFMNSYARKLIVRSYNFER